MSEKEKKANSSAMKVLRQERSETIAKARAAVKEQSGVIKGIREALTPAPKTIPEIAEAVSMETEQVLQYISTLKRYGIVGEGAKDGDYFKYELTC